MYQLTVSAVCAYVRKAMDELTSVEEIGMLVSPDAVDIHKLVEASIVEAAVRVHNLAPAIMLDGVQGALGTDYDEEFETGDTGVLTITMLKDTIRVVSLQAHDSAYVICDFIPEDSAEGRKQLNKFVRGVPDDPRVVLCKTWSDDYKPILKYYTTSDINAETESTTETETDADDSTKKSNVDLYYVPYPVIDETIVMICPKLEHAVLNEVTAMVLDSLNEHNKATLYRTKAKEYMGL